ncbi:MAG: hypothetical protein P4M08_00605 [Oligoflexia bacterium]|nr:hypothetical protein [Oligoflexia bacterium]
MGSRLTQAVYFSAALLVAEMSASLAAAPPSNSIPSSGRCNSDEFTVNLVHLPTGQLRDGCKSYLTGATRILMTSAAPNSASSTGTKALRDPADQAAEEIAALGDGPNVEAVGAANAVFAHLGGPWNGTGSAGFSAGGV